MSATKHCLHALKKLSFCPFHVFQSNNDCDASLPVYLLHTWSTVLDWLLVITETLHRCELISWNKLGMCHHLKKLFKSVAASWLVIFT